MNGEAGRATVGRFAGDPVEAGRRRSRPADSATTAAGHNKPSTVTFGAVPRQQREVGPRQFWSSPSNWVQVIATLGVLVALAVGVFAVTSSRNRAPAAGTVVEGTSISADGQILSGAITGLVVRCTPSANYAEVDLANDTSRPLSVNVEVALVNNKSEVVMGSASRRIGAGKATWLGIRGVSRPATSGTCRLARVTASR